MQYERHVTVALPFEQAVPVVVQALGEQGFGILTEIDVQAVLRDERGVEIEQYVVLGACNPDLAHRALEVDRSIGVLLPCNVVVREDGAKTTVQVFEPMLMTTVVGREELYPVVVEADLRLHRVLDAVLQAAQPP